MNAPKFVIRNIRFFEREVKLRLPFRFGVVTLTQCPQVYVNVTLEFANSKRIQGCAAEMMVPKWFDKNKELSNEENFNQLRKSLTITRDAYLSDLAPKNTWQYFSHYYASIIKEGEQHQLNHLTSNYGPALIDRALIDALCHFLGINFYDAIHSNQIGLNSTELPQLTDLRDFDVSKFLSSLSCENRISARHTVGLLDSLEALNSGTDPTLNPKDNLPITLKQVVKTYGHRYYKLKVSGDFSSDIERLKQIAPIIQDIAKGITLDGNEQYSNPEAFLEFFRAFRAEPSLEALFNKVIFIEQPLHRDVTMQSNVVGISKYKPLLIDESDSDLDSFLKAIDLGYTGVSSKSCKGLYKSLINAARTKQRNAASQFNEISYFQSGEDLTMQAGVAVQQDLALVNLLGLRHVERNGHHYVNGMQGIPNAEQDAFLDLHPDLYTRDDSRVRLQIKQGEIDITSLRCKGFGTAVQGGGIDWNSFSHNY
jgi:hypothetical protein